LFFVGIEGTETGMPKAQKIEAVEELRERLQNSTAALLTSFTGLKVAEMTELRRALAGSQAEFRVVKNTLARIAATQSGFDELIPLLEGSTAIAFVTGDPVVAAKGLDEVSKKYPALVLKGGLLTGKVLSAERAAALASVAPRDVLLAQLAGAFQAPLAKLAALLQAPLRSLGYALGAYREKVTAGAPAAEPAVEAPAVEPAVEAPAVEPAVEAPAVEPAVEAPAAEPAVEAPAGEPAVEAPAAEPAVEAPGAEAPAPEAPSAEEPADAPAAEPAANSEA
jgi:large subunit ribosomal protein L10